MLALLDKLEPDSFSCTKKSTGIHSETVNFNASEGLLGLCWMLKIQGDDSGS